MGFLDHSTNNIIIDAVLTDRGRELLAANDGSFTVARYAFGDDEIDYSIIKKFGRTIGKEKIATTQFGDFIKYNAPKVEKLNKNIDEQYKFLRETILNVSERYSLKIDDNKINIFIKYLDFYNNMQLTVV